MKLYSKLLTALFALLVSINGQAQTIESTNSNARIKIGIAASMSVSSCYLPVSSFFHPYVLLVVLYFALEIKAILMACHVF